MKLPRRQLLPLAAGAAALPALSRFAGAQAYPTRPVRILVGFAAGGNFDIVARLIGQWLSEQLQQPVIVENRPGASSNIATEAVIRAPADGYTLLLGGAVNAVNATLYEKLSFNFISDVAPVAGVVRFPNVMTVECILSGEDGSRIHRLRESKPGQDQPRLVRQRDHATSRRRTVQDDDRRRLRPCALSRRVAGDHRSARRASAGSVRTLARVDPAHQIGPAPRLGGDDGRAFGGAAGPADRGRIRARLRGQRVERRLCAQEHAGRNHREAQSGDQCGPCRSQAEGPPRRPGRHDAWRLVRRLRQSSSPKRPRSGARSSAQATSSSSRLDRQCTGSASCASPGSPKSIVVLPARPRRIGWLRWCPGATFPVLGAGRCQSPYSR